MSGTPKADAGLPLCSNTKSVQVTMTICAFGGGGGEMCISMNFTHTKKICIKHE